MRVCSRAALVLWLMAAAGLGVCLAQVVPPDQGAGKVVQLTGQVSVLRDGAPWALNVGDWVRPRQIVVTGAGGFAIFQLADGSTFEVFPNSRVSFRDNPGDFRDLLDLWLGRVKVHIQKLGGQPNRNRVRTPTAVISVRGTVFHVVLEDELDTTLVSVEEGLVAVQHALLPRGDPKLVNAGEYIRVYKNQPLASRQIDKGSAVQKGLRMLADALYDILIRNPGGSGPAPGGGTSTGPQAPGDTPSTPPPPPPAEDPSSAPPPAPGP